MSSFRQRDYRAEYTRRITSAAKRGLSRSQARGHARIGEAPIRRPSRQHDRERFEAALKLYRETGNQSAAAKAVNLAPERLRRFLRENVQIEGRGGSLKISDRRPREMAVISDGDVTTRLLRDFDQASFNGQHLNAVKAYISSGEIEYLIPFEGRVVIDAKGKAHPLETNPNALHRLHSAGEEVFHEIYRHVF